MAERSAWKIALIVLAFLMFALVVFFNGLAASNLGHELGLMNNQTVFISDKYLTGITPDGWTFSIWSVIYTWQALLLIYGLTTICLRSEKSGRYLYIDPEVVPFYFYILYIANMAFNLTWIFLFDLEEHIAGLVFLALIAFSLYVCNFVSYRSLSKNGSQMTREGLTKHIWFVRILVHNGVALYATWTSIATLLNFVIVLTYGWSVTTTPAIPGSVDMNTACWTALIILNVEVAVWFTLETFIFDKHLRYTFTPYIVLCVALAGILTKRTSAGFKYADEDITTYVYVLIGLSALLGVVKFIVMVWRHMKQPITYTGSNSFGTLGKGDIPM